jgi:hypothetical protein
LALRYTSWLEKYKFFVLLFWFVSYLHPSYSPLLLLSSFVVELARIGVLIC